MTRCGPSRRRLRRWPNWVEWSRIVAVLGLVCGPGAQSVLAEESPDSAIPDPGLLLVHVHLVDPAAETVTAASLLLANGRVIARGEADGTSLAEAAPGAEVRDLDGAFVLPGLVDLRVHAGTQRSPGHADELGAVGTSRLLTAAGVTRYLDLYLGESAREWQRRQVETASKSSRIELGTPILTSPGGAGADLPTARTVRSTAEVDTLLQRYAPYGGEPRVAAMTVVFDSRPPHRRLSRKILAHLMSATRQHDLVVAVEVGNWNDVEEALSEGARLLCHLPEGDPPERVRELVRALRPRWIPTVAVGVDFVELLGNETLRNDPLLRRLAPAELIEDYPKVHIPQARYADVRQRRRDLYASMSTLDELGARWMAGSDAGAVGTVFGWTLHRELEHWRAAGIGTWKILRGATVDPARMLGQRYGFDAGATADFVIVAQNPADDLTALRSPIAVIAQGRWVDLDAILATVRRQVTEDYPPNPIPFGGKMGLLIIVVLGFTVLLGIRAAIKRAVRAGDPS